MALEAAPPVAPRRAVVTVPHRFEFSAPDRALLEQHVAAVNDAVRFQPERAADIAFTLLTAWAFSEPLTVACCSFSKAPLCPTMSAENTELHRHSATSLARGLREGKWTSVALTEHFLRRIREINPQIHAVPYVFEKEALGQARASDARRASGNVLSEIDGLPMTIKDAMRVKNSSSTYGTWLLRFYRPTGDSQLINILRKSGVVFLGRTAVPTWSFDWNCKNWLYPECVNPHNSSRTPGGSSGGAAAALASGLTPLELGSDVAGSLRYPAHCCGIYSLRTTDGWLPIDDFGPEIFGPLFRQLLTLGPMAAHVEDLALLLGRFASLIPERARPCAAPSGGPLKIAFSRDLLGVRTEPSSAALFDRFLGRLESRGHTLVEAKPPIDFSELYRDWGILAGHENVSAMPWIVRRPPLLAFYAWWTLNRRMGRGPFTTHFKNGLFASEADYAAACARRTVIFDTVDRFFAEHALWILPVSPSAAIPRSWSGKMIQTADGKFDYSTYLGSYLAPTTVLGTPVLTCPIGVDHDQMPVGVQIHGPRYSDRWLVRAVMDFDSLRTPARTRRPSY
ncbi:MAG: amidase [Undibacterium sp.]|nr:amidase [Opitutaceae bacterium]